MKGEAWSVEDDEKLLARWKAEGRIKDWMAQWPEYGMPEDSYFAAFPNTRMRKDSRQIVFYGSTFLDFWGYRLTPPQAIILALFDGTRRLRDVRRMVQDYAGGTDELNDLKIRRALAQVEASKGQSRFIVDAKPITADHEVFDPRDFFIPHDEVELTVDLDKPIAMMWMPTSVCQTDCVYCYATRKTMEPSRLLTDQRVRELLDEAGDIGICTMNVDGGDALCRKNIAELLAYAIGKRMSVDLSTKAYISRAMARDLVAAGIGIIQIGFDAPYPDLFDKTVGVTGHFHRTLESIKNCAEEGLSVRTNSILTAETHVHVRQLVHLLSTLPLVNWKIAPAFRTAHRHREGLLLSEQQKQWLREEVRQLQLEHGDKVQFECQSDYQALSSDERQRAFHDFPRCGIGRECIIITPDGKVSMCEQAPYAEEFIVGDVSQQSIVEVWQGEAMRKFKFPSADDFKGTACHGCEDFEDCYHKKGGCMILSVKAYATRFAPSPCCPKAPPYSPPVQ